MKAKSYLAVVLWTILIGMGVAYATGIDLKMSPLTGSTLTLTPGPLHVGANGMDTDGGMTLSTDIHFVTGSTGSYPGDSSYNCAEWGPAVGGNHWYMCGKPNVGWFVGNNTAQYMSLSLANGRATFSNGIHVGTIYNSSTVLMYSATAPTLASFGGTGAAVSASNGTAAFDINVGTGAPGSTGTITFPAATTGWNCYCHDITTTPLVRATVQTGGSTTTCVIAEVTTSTGAALNWTASDHLRCTAMAF